MRPETRQSRIDSRQTARVSSSSDEHSPQRLAKIDLTGSSDRGPSTTVQVIERAESRHSSWVFRRIGYQDAVL